MPITKAEFQNIKYKVITLMGMSGVGKTHLSLMLAQQGWKHYFCDLEIGRFFLKDEIEKALGEDNQITADDLSQLSRYIGRVGNPEKGGLPYDIFMKRQQEYYMAECGALLKLQDVINKATRSGYTNTVNDSTGSLCEIDNDTLFEFIDENSLIVYIEASEEEKQTVLKRAQEYPKPMFFSPEKFEGWVKAYGKEKGDIAPEDFDPDDFSRWVFPQLLDNRLPKYKRIADRYGVTIPSDAFRGINTSKDFLEIIEHYLPDTL
ncbi:MAG: hypothetical protein AAF549_03495 [Pseudomonadota bacterium]